MASAKLLIILFFVLVLLICSPVLYYFKIREERKYKKYGVKAVGYIVAYHPELKYPESRDGSLMEVAQILVFAGDDSNRYRQAHDKIAKKISDLEVEDPKDPIERRVSKWVNYEDSKWHKLPKELTDGREAYLMRTYVWRDLLPDNTLLHPFVRVLVLWEEPDSYGKMIKYKESDQDYINDD
jgi:hypothetical protein